MRTADDIIDESKNRQMPQDVQILVAEVERLRCDIVLIECEGILLYMTHDLVYAHKENAEKEYNR